MEEKITIIVPIYNAQDSLRRCIESLINQSYLNIEIILVNDGSKDNSLNICKEYQQKDSRVVVIDKVNGGVSTARNAGIKLASGDLIAFCDSDDWVERTWIEILHQYYEPNSLVMCGYFSHKTNGDCERTGVSSIVEKLGLENYLATKLIGGFVPWNKLFERRIIEKYDIRFPVGITVGEDKLFIWRYLKHLSGEIICVGQELNHYNWPSDNSLTVNLPENYYSQCFFIYKEMKLDIDNGFNCSEKSLKAFYNDSYLQLECAIRSIFKSKIAWNTKIKQVNKIMRNKIYLDCAKAAQISSNATARFLCKRKSCYGIYFLYLINKY